MTNLIGPFQRDQATLLAFKHRPPGMRLGYECLESGPPAVPFTSTQSRITTPQPTNAFYIQSPRLQTALCVTVSESLGVCLSYISETNALPFAPRLA